MCLGSQHTLDEERRPVLAQVELRKVRNEEGHCEGAVDADKEVSSEPQDDRGVEVAPRLVSSHSVHDVQRKRYHNAKQERDRHPLVAGADTEQVWSNTPGNSQGVELLNVLA